MKNKILFVLSLLFGLFFVFVGLEKIFHFSTPSEEMPEAMKNMMAAFMQIAWLMPLVGIIEFVGGILFIIPKLRPLGAIIIFPIVIGIMLTNIFVSTESIALAIIILIINLWVIYENKAKYMPMIK